VEQPVPQSVNGLNELTITGRIYAPVVNYVC